MKKFLAIILAIVTCFAFVACSSSTDSGSSSVEKTQTTYKIGVVDGAPSLSGVNNAKRF